MERAPKPVIKKEEKIVVLDPDEVDRRKYVGDLEG